MSEFRNIKNRGLPFLTDSSGSNARSLFLYLNQSNRVSFLLQILHRNYLVFALQCDQIIIQANHTARPAFHSCYLINP